MRETWFHVTESIFMNKQQPDNPLSASPLGTFLGNLAAKIPAPGGGASACVTGAIAAAQARMVVAYSLGRKSLAEYQTLLADADARLERAGTLFLTLAEEDARAYTWLNELERLAEGDARRAEIPAARAAATDVPRASVATACEVLRVIEGLIGKTNPHLRSDLAIAAVLAAAACTSGAWNVWINTRGMEEKAREAIDSELAAARREAEERAARVEAACRVVG